MSVKADFFIVGKSDVASEGLSRPRVGVPIGSKGIKTAFEVSQLRLAVGIRIADAFLSMLHHYHQPSLVWKTYQPLGGASGGRDDHSCAAASGDTSRA